MSATEPETQYKKEAEHGDDTPDKNKDLQAHNTDKPMYVHCEVKLDNLRRARGRIGDRR